MPRAPQSCWGNLAIKPAAHGTIEAVGGIVLPQIGSGGGVRFRVCSASGVLEHHGERCGRWSDRRRRPSTKAGRNRRMANETPGGQDPKFERRVEPWPGSRPSAEVSTPRSTFWPMPPPSVPQYHRRQTLGRESGDGRPERASTALELAESRATPSGVTIQVYRPAGRPQYARSTERPRPT